MKSSLINHDASHFSVHYFNSTFVGCFASGVSLQRQIGKVMRVFLGKQSDKCGNSSFVCKSKEDSCFATRKQYPILNDKATENEVKLAWRTILTDMLITNKSPLPSWNLSINREEGWKTIVNGRCLVQYSPVAYCYLLNLFSWARGLYQANDLGRYLCDCQIMDSGMSQSRW